MPTGPSLILSNDRLEPAYEPFNVMELPVNLQPLQAFAKGTVLGQVTNAVNEVQSLTITASGGTYTLTYVDPVTNVPYPTAALAYNANAAAIAAAINAVVGASTVGVTGTGPYTITFSGTNVAGKPQNLLSVNTANLTGGTATPSRTTSGAAANVWKAYNSGNSDGSQVPKLILQYACTTDALGRVFIGPNVFSQWGDTRFDAPAYAAGTFMTKQLVGLDSNALSAGAWRLISGTVADGVVRLG